MRHKILKLLPIYCIALSLFVFIGIGGSRAITVFSEHAPVKNRVCVIIDAGHGGVDGGTTSCTGVEESKINLQIALKLRDVMHLLGMKTQMIRTTDTSIHTGGNTIAAKKVSDLKERVRIVNETANSILISIHQNYFAQNQYHGAQVFYAATEESESLAKQLQKELIAALNHDSHRQAKKASGIYLMQHIERPGILIECGFLSNPEEEALLRSSQYQNKLCAIIASVCSSYLDTYK